MEGARRRRGGCGGCQAVARRLRASCRHDASQQVRLHGQRVAELAREGTIASGGCGAGGRWWPSDERTNDGRRRGLAHVVRRVIARWLWSRAEAEQYGAVE